MSYKLDVRFFLKPSAVVIFTWPPSLMSHSQIIVINSAYMYAHGQCFVTQKADFLIQIVSVVACQRYLCPYVIPMTMNAFIFKNLSLKTVLLNHMSK